MASPILAISIVPVSAVSLTDSFAKFVVSPIAPWNLTAPLPDLTTSSLFPSIVAVELKVIAPSTLAVSVRISTLAPRVTGPVTSSLAPV